MLVPYVRNPDDYNRHYDINLRNVRETSCPTDGPNIEKNVNFFMCLSFCRTCNLRHSLVTGNYVTHTSWRFYRGLPDETGNFRPCSLLVLFTIFYVYFVWTNSPNDSWTLPLRRFFQTNHALARYRRHR